MKRGKKLMLLLAVLVVLMGATALAGRLNPENDDTETEAAGTVILALEPDNVTELSWTYEEETLSFVKSEGAWVYAEDNSFPLSTVLLEVMLADLSDVVSTKTIGGAEDLSQYGLEEPACTITVAADTTYTLQIGEATELTGERYFSMGDGNVYLVDAGILEDFSYGLYDLVQEETIPTMSDLCAVVVEADGQTMELAYQSDSSFTYQSDIVWFLKEGDDWLALDTDKVEDFAGNITDLSWVSCVDYAADTVEQKEYGLTDPTAQITIGYIETAETATGEVDEDGNAVYETNSTVKQFILEIGATEGDYCYARIAGSDMVYQIDGTICDTMRFVTYEDLRQEEILSLDWSTVTSMDILLDGQTYTVEWATKEVTDEEGNTTETEISLLNGIEADTTEIVDALNTLTATGSSSTATPEREAEISFVFHRNTEEFTQVELILYTYNGDSCLVGLDGETRLFVDRADVVSLIETVNSLILE